MGESHYSACIRAGQATHANSHTYVYADPLIHTHPHTHTHTRTHTHAHTRTHTHTHTHAHAHTHTHTHAHAHTRWGVDRRNDIGPDSHPCPPWASSPTVGGATR